MQGGRHAGASCIILHSNLIGPQSSHTILVAFASFVVPTMDSNCRRAILSYSRVALLPAGAECRG